MWFGKTRRVLMCCLNIGVGKAVEYLFFILLVRCWVVNSLAFLFFLLVKYVFQNSCIFFALCLLNVDCYFRRLLFVSETLIILIVGVPLTM